MSDSEISRTKRKVIVLATHSGIKEVSSLYAVLAAALASETKIVLDASKLETVDTCVLQLLSAFATAARQAKRELSWAATSKVLCLSAKLLDLDKQLGLPAV